MSTVQARRYANPVEIPLGDGRAKIRALKARVRNNFVNIHCSSIYRLLITAIP